MARRHPVAPTPDERSRQWHRLFGLLLTDYLTDSPFTVEVEKDLSQRAQRLDVVVVRRRPGPVPRPLPDGLDDFVAHNLISFKSFQEPLDDWTLKELTGHYVNYRKQVSPRQRLLPETDFRLYAVCARYPRELFRAVAVTPLQEGVYQLQRGTDAIRVVVVSDLPTTERNALLHLFSAVPDRVEYGATHYRLQTADMSSIIGQLFEQYGIEVPTMAYTWQDYLRDYGDSFLNKLVKERLATLSPEERLAGLDPKELLATLNPKELLATLNPEERLAGLDPKELLAGLSVEERLAGLSPEQIEAYLQRLRHKRPARKKRTPKNGR